MELSKYRAQIEAALEYASGTHTYSDVEDAVKKGELQLWGGVKSVILTELQKTPQKLILNYFLAGGSVVELSAMTGLIESWGKSVGAVQATLYGRPGWQRSFLTKEQGWEAKLVVMEKKL